jgi:glucokinase-like ROK family protein
MSRSFFEEINTGSPTGVAYKNINQKKQILSHLAEFGHTTVAELAKPLNLSIPKVKSLLDDLMEERLIREFGKDDSTGGRRPSLYGLRPDAGFFLGIDIKQNHINIGLTDFEKNVIRIEENYEYKLENSEKSLEDLCNLINQFIDSTNVPRKKFLGAGINLSGRINHTTGYSYSFFHFHEDPLSSVIEKRIGLKVYLENDSRAMAYGEYSAGVVEHEKDIIFLNMDYGIGAGILVNGQLYYGKSGYAGEFGHIPIYTNETLCHCGKRGCLETEASGRALVQNIKDRLSEGASSILSTIEDVESITLEQVLEAAKNDDVLCIENIAEIGEKIGRGLAILINIFNPELIILGGSLATTEDYIRFPIKSAVNKYSLSLVNKDTSVKLSKLQNTAGVIGACLLVRNHLLTLS